MTTIVIDSSPEARRVWVLRTVTPRGTRLGMTDADLIDRLGGVTAVARLVGAKRPQVVSNWKKRGIPAEYRAVVAELARRREIPLDRERFLGFPPDLGAAA